MQYETVQITSSDTIQHETIRFLQYNVIWHGTHTTTKCGSTIKFPKNQLNLWYSAFFSKTQYDIIWRGIVWFTTRTIQSNKVHYNIWCNALPYNTDTHTKTVDNMIGEDTVWYSIIHNDTVWYILEQFRTVWCVMMLYGTIWYFPEVSSCRSWNSLLSCSFP